MKINKTAIVRALVAALIAAALVFAGAAPYTLPGGDRVTTTIGN